MYNTTEAVMDAAPWEEGVAKLCLFVRRVAFQSPAAVVVLYVLRRTYLMCCITNVSILTGYIVHSLNPADISWGNYSDGRVVDDLFRYLPD